MSKLLKSDPQDETVNWTEDDMQMYAVKFLKRHPAFNKRFSFAADQNEGKRNARDAARRKALGMTAGEPDLRFYFEGARFKMIEAKRKGNYPSKEQKERIALLKSLGFDVRVVTGVSPADFCNQLMDIFEEWLQPES